MSLVGRLRRHLVSSGLNNTIINNILILTRRDGLIKRLSDQWRTVQYDETKSLQQNVGYSHYDEIERSLERMRTILRETAREHVPPAGEILEVGCGPGLFLQELRGYRLTGIDLNQSFLAKARGVIPDGTFIPGDYMTCPLEKQFDMVYLVSVIQYIEPSRIVGFFRKTAGHLKRGGVLLVNYSHALGWRDLLYPDLRYVRYSPRKIRRLASREFEIVRHSHLMDEREVDRFDPNHYYFPDGTDTRTDTNLNTCVLVARKR